MIAEGDGGAWLRIKKGRSRGSSLNKTANRINACNIDRRKISKARIPELPADSTSANFQVRQDPADFIPALIVRDAKCIASHIPIRTISAKERLTQI